jgi:hypothetical protein
MCWQVTGMRSIAAIALERRHVCNRSWKARSIARNCLRNSTAQGLKRWWLGQRVRRGLTRHALDCRPWVRAQCSRLPFCALERSGREQNFTSFALFHPLRPWFECKDLQHHKILKQAKTLNNNKAKGLTNIN